METRTAEYQHAQGMIFLLDLEFGISYSFSPIFEQMNRIEYVLDPERFRFARHTSFRRRHMSPWTQSPTLLWLVIYTNSCASFYD